MSNYRLFFPPFLVLIISLAASAGCSFTPAVQGSGVAKTEARQVAAFSKIKVDGFASVTVNVDPQKPQSVSITTDDNILPIVESVVHNDTLVISEQKSVSTRIGVKVVISVPQLDGGEINGSGDLIVHALASKSFRAAISGSGNVTMDGAADAIDASISGSGNINASKLSAQDARVSISGSGDAKVNAAKSLDARITGSGDIRYIGSPAVSKQVTGSGSVKQSG